MILTTPRLDQNANYDATAQFLADKYQLPIFYTNFDFMQL